MAAVLRKVSWSGLLSNNARHYLSAASRNLSKVDTVTHTGQVFENDDYKRVRFTNRMKTVNEQFAIDLINEEAPIEVDGRVVWCDGGGGPLGHPKVFINLDRDGVHICGYCGLRYVMKRKDH
ncbi:NADH dehydrogenase [ubiquinone] iron-sulfur protein 6, mitochondrial-like [Xenia sp. Carnegie-2017]|uniref:NADH dehydrogenase [ubiquinone] iron-sulfur protein 6, mitochondrial-like n=1 Tax=Xenia sp. Carnegie-2017 TaxID=2897299 RepID=UPI001F034CD1|nr:NADH dehydrogenase [ubiquinone] iron-sulfur protein 6, mitochondrial-like [Xenia sp. Carnegie-2017]